jgi:hypothetical protein
LKEQLLLILIHLIQLGEDIVHFNTLRGVGLGVVIEYHPIPSEGEIPKNHRIPQKGYTHNEISKILRCSPSTIQKVKGMVEG